MHAHTPPCSYFYLISPRNVSPDLVHGVCIIDPLRSEIVHLPLQTHRLQMAELGPREGKPHVQSHRTTPGAKMPHQQVGVASELQLQSPEL